MRTEEQIISDNYVNVKNPENPLGKQDRPGNLRTSLC